MSCTLAVCAVTAMILPTSPLPASVSPAMGVAPTTGRSTLRPSAEPLSIRTQASQRVGDLPMTRATSNSVPSGIGALVAQIEQALEALVLLRLLLRA